MKVRPDRVDLEINQSGFGPSIAILKRVEGCRISAERGVRLRRRAGIDPEWLRLCQTAFFRGLGHLLHGGSEPALSIKLLQRLTPVGKTGEAVILHAFLEPKIVLARLTMVFREVKEHWYELGVHGHNLAVSLQRRLVTAGQIIPETNVSVDDQRKRIQFAGALQFHDRFFMASLRAQ